MSTNGIETERELQQILWACYDFWKESSRPPNEREIYYGWIIDRYKNKFGASFHQATLRRLITLGYLAAGDTARGGDRRYYKLVDPNKTANDLKSWGF